MKKTIFDRRLLPAWILACVCLLTLPQAANAQEQRVKFTSPSMTVNDALVQIEKQTGLKFGLSEPFDVSKTVDFGTTELSLEQALTLISKPDHSFSFYQNYILIQKKAPASSIIGKVVEQTSGKALSGARVELAGSNGVSLQTRADGTFGFNELAPGKYAVRIIPADNRPAYSTELSTTAANSIPATIVYPEAPKVAAQAPEVKPAVADSKPLTYFYYDNTNAGFAGEPATNYSYIPSDKLYTDYTPKAAVKTNFLIWATTTPNVSLEFALGRKWTFEPTFAYNPWRFDSEKSYRLWFVQPELRYWFCNAFENHFIGLHGIYGEYNVGNFDLPFTDVFVDTKYKGKAYGGGISYGYHMPIAKRWGLEFTLGVGYLKLDYDKYNCSSCDEYLGSYEKDYFGVTKAGISMVFMLK